VKRVEYTGLSVITAVYIGQTGRRLDTRYAEHKRALQNKKQNESAFADHLLTTNHSPNTQSPRLLHNVEKGKKLTALELVEINKAKFNPNCNILNNVIP